jgi:hypothetical protein
MAKKTRVPSRHAPKAADRALSVEIAIAPDPAGSTLAYFTSDLRPRASNIDRFRCDPARFDRAVAELAQLGFRIVAISKFSISTETSPENYEKVFGTKLETRSLKTFSPEGFRPPREMQMDVTGRKFTSLATPVATTFFAPKDDAPWQVEPALEGLVMRAAIQRPYLYFDEFAVPPPGIGYHHLRTPGDIAMLTRATLAHRQGFTGKGVKVAMVDSGFHIDHPFYVEMGYNMSRLLAPDATDLDTDDEGHGSAEAANILAIAPDVTFIGVKAGANLTAAFKEAVRHSPDIISVSLGFDLRGANGLPLTKLPDNLKPLEAEVAAAVAAKITVVFSAGNGHISFPGMHPNVISAGGTYVDRDGSLQASDYGSAFVSQIYPSRAVPDLTGLVGLMATKGAYLMLPLPEGCKIDHDAALDSEFKDGTAKDDGWAVISGTSAAAPQLAGVCALLKQKNPGLTPSEIKAVLSRTARDVTTGHANEVANPVSDGHGGVKFVPLAAGPGPDAATGSGLVDALAALRQV